MERELHRLKLARCVPLMEYSGEVEESGEGEDERDEKLLVVEPEAVGSGHVEGESDVSPELEREREGEEVPL